MARLAYRLTQRAWPGVVGFASQVPLFFLAAFAGVWADRWDRRRLMVVTQTLSMCQSFGLSPVAWKAAGSDAAGDRGGDRPRWRRFRGW